MAPITATTIAVTAVVGGVVVCLAMILRFLLTIYNRGGADDVGSVAKALREVYDPRWPTRALRYLGSADVRETGGRDT